MNVFANDDGTLYVVGFYDHPYPVYRQDDPYAPQELHDAMAPIIAAGNIPPLPDELKPELEPENPVPAVISMRQAKLQLSRVGLLAAANTAIAEMEGRAGEEARIEWEYAAELRRDHPLVAGIGAVLDLDDEAIDGLFLDAAKIG